MQINLRLLQGMYLKNLLTHMQCQSYKIMLRLDSLNLSHESFHEFIYFTILKIVFL